MKVKIFIDGSAGTTGLRIHERLMKRDDITVLSLPESSRKDFDARKQMLNDSDIAFLCLPDNAADEAVNMLHAENKNTAIIDTSTAHRTSEGWVYGFPELEGQRRRIASSKRIANPGCHASGFIALVAPLTENRILKHNVRLSCFSITGYSGGGKKMISEYEDENKKTSLAAPRQYGFSQSHKHLPEMIKFCSLDIPPVFCPVVSSYYSGMEVTVPLHKDDLSGNIEDIKDVYKDYYRKGLVCFCENPDENGFLSAGSFAGRDDMQIAVTGNDERILLIARFDNLGKGASGAAIQNMNILIGTDEFTGLNIGGK